MTKGYANREIADVHQSLPDTVKQHRRRVLEKMQVDSLPALLELLEGFDLLSWLDEMTPRA
jgi:FixJ family two-component response regulator